MPGLSHRAVLCYAGAYGTAAPCFHSTRLCKFFKWREYDAEDTIRFYALSLHQLGMIKTDPKHVIADGTDWRFLDERKREG
jgi:hypothetical protein